MAAKLTRRGLKRAVGKARVGRVIPTKCIVNPRIQSKFRAGGSLTRDARAEKKVHRDLSQNTRRTLAGHFMC
jgi:hypothetical protein